MSTEDKKKGISRRAFIKGAAIGAAGIASAGTLAGCGKEEPAPKTSGQASPCSSVKYSFETPPPLIPESKIKKTVTADVMVIGAGTAGLCTAVRAAECGTKVVVIAKDSTVSARGGSNFAIGSKLTKSLGLEFDVAAAYERMLQFHSHHVNEELWWLFAKRSGEAMD